MADVVTFSIFPEPSGTNSGRWITIQWERALGVPRTGLYRLLENAIDAVYGVERVQMNRYSAAVLIADHVTRIDDVLREVREVFEDEEVIRGVRFQFTADTVIRVLP